MNELDVGNVSIVGNKLLVLLGIANRIAQNSFRSLINLKFCLPERKILHRQESPLSSDESTCVTNLHIWYLHGWWLRRRRHRQVVERVIANPAKCALVV